MGTADMINLDAMEEGFFVTRHVVAVTMEEGKVPRETEWWVVIHTTSARFLEAFATKEEAVARYNQIRSMVRAI